MEQEQDKHTQAHKQTHTFGTMRMQTNCSIVVNCIARDREGGEYWLHVMLCLVCVNIL